MASSRGRRIAQGVDATSSRSSRAAASGVRTTAYFAEMSSAQGVYRYQVPKPLYLYFELSAIAICWYQTGM